MTAASTAATHAIKKYKPLNRARVLTGMVAQACDHSTMKNVARGFTSLEPVRSTNNVLGQLDLYSKTLPQQKTKRKV